MKILVVEDSEGVQCYLAMLLEQYGYDVVTADDGQQAWKILQQQQDIHLVLTDWMMPNMNGLQLCQTIRQAALSRYIYIILLTGKEGDSVLVQGMEAGADDFLIKPINKNELRVRLNAGRRILELEETLKSAYEQISQDLYSAAKVQNDLLPKPKTLGNFKFEWLFYPSRFVAGDIFNFFELDEKHIGFYQLDVSGNGLRSALLSFTLYHRITNDPAQAGLLLRKTRGGFTPVPPEQVVCELNNRFQSHVDPMLYFTIIYGYIHKRTGKIRFTQAGHPNPIYLAHADGHAQLCGNGGFPVGMLPEMEFETTTLTLKPGDRLFIYSDGVTECANKDNELFLETHLIESLEQARYYPLKEVLQHVGKSLQTWRNNDSEVFDDDTTLLAIERI